MTESVASSPSLIERDPTLEFLSILFEPDQTFEIRAIGPGGVSYGYFKDVKKAAAKIKILDDLGTFSGIYVTINAINPALYARKADKIEKAGRGETSTGDADVVRRKWLLIDVDPVRPSGISANDEEISHADNQIRLAEKFLQEMGFGEGIFADSGNGRHLLYRIDLPNNSESTDLIKGVLLTLDRFFSIEECKFDTGVFNAARISKIYGTVSRKGDNTQDRPHRRSKIIRKPVNIQTVTLAALRNLASLSHPDPEEKKPKTQKSGDFIDASIFLDRWNLSYTIKNSGDEIVFKLDQCPFSSEHTDGAYVSQNKKTGALKAACYHQSCGAGANRWKELRAKYEPDYDPDKDYNSVQKTKKSGKAENNDEEEEQIRHLPYFERDEKLFLTCITPGDSYFYAHLEDGKIIFSLQEQDPMGVLTVPPHLPVHQDRGTTTYIVGLPRTDLLEQAELLSPGDIYTKIRDHFYRYFDAPEIEYELFVYYCLYSWFFSKCSTTPYLRFLGDTGKGKSRFLKTISDLCFYPIRASGSSSLSGIMRFKERWMGTLLIDESDLKGDQSDPLIKYLNLGFEKDNYFILTDKNDVSKSHVFDPYGPKVIAMRQPFRDSATEGRCLSFSPSETTREDIPPELPSKYFEEVAEIRAFIARFVLKHWNEVNEACMINCNGMGLEGRIKQMARPLSIILRLFPDGADRFKTYLNYRQKEIKQTRSESWEGAMFNYALQLAFDEESLMLDPEFGRYYYGGKIQAILPKMIAEALKIKPKSVTIALEGIGMEVKPRRVPITNVKGGKSTIKTRPLTVPNKKKWQEIIQRYYYNEDGGDLPECPDCLKGPQYNTIQSSVLGKYGSEDPDQNNENRSVGVSPTSGTSGTRGTDHTDEIPGSDQSGTVVPHVPLHTNTPSNLKDWLSYHGFPADLPVRDYVVILPKEARKGLYCRCKGCYEPDKSLPLYWIPSHPYNQICQKHYNELKSLIEKEDC